MGFTGALSNTKIFSDMSQGLYFKSGTTFGTSTINGTSLGAWGAFNETPAINQFVML